MRRGYTNIILVLNAVKILTYNVQLWLNKYLLTLHYEQEFIRFSLKGFISVVLLEYIVNNCDKNTCL